MPRIKIGQEVEIKTLDVWSSDRVKVFALAEDSETPFVILRFYDWNGNMVFEHSLEDVFAETLAQRNQKALDVLPSSK